jgi:hypothetical protein
MGRFASTAQGKTGLPAQSLDRQVTESVERATKQKALTQKKTRHNRAGFSV